MEYDIQCFIKCDALDLSLFHVLMTLRDNLMIKKIEGYHEGLTFWINHKYFSKKLITEDGKEYEVELSEEYSKEILYLVPNTHVREFYNLTSSINYINLIKFYQVDNKCCFLLLAPRNMNINININSNVYFGSEVPRIPLENLRDWFKCKILTSDI